MRGKGCVYAAWLLLSVDRLRVRARASSGVRVRVSARVKGKAEDGNEDEG